MKVKNLDPFLYRSYETPVEKRLKEILPTDKKLLWEDSEKLKNISPEVRKKIPSSAFSYTPSREAVIKHIGTDENRKKLYEAAEQFEAFFLEKMFREMKKNLLGDRLIHGGFAEEVFDEMLLTERVNQMAFRYEFGLAEKIYQQLANI